MLDLVTLAGRGDPVKLRCGESLWEAAVEASVDQVAGRVTAVGWQPGRAAALAGEAGAARSGLDVAATPAPAAAGADDPVRLVEGAVGSDEAAAGLAQATLDTRVAGSVVLRGIAAGTAALWPGARVEVDGLDDTVDGGYVLTAVTHTVDGNGYLSSVSTEPPAPPRPAALPAVTLGVVTAVDDPDGLGRVRVTLPAFGEVDAGWLAVLTPGAGADRGLVIRPEVDDTVLVALAQQSPAAGVVLGGLYGPGSPPDASPRRWTLRTGQGQSIVVDDEHDRVRVENRGGSYVDLSPGEVRLHAAADLVLDAAGHAVTIRAASVDFQHQPIPLSG
jgi:phage baseplate assembly protein gpV